MKDKSLAVAGINFRNNKLAYLIVAIVGAAIVVQDIVFLVLLAFGIEANGPENMSMSLGDYLFLLIILSAIFFPALNFRKIMNLGGKRTGFFKGCFVNYVILTAVLSLASVVIYYTYDALMVSKIYRGGTLALIYWFGWVGNGPVVAYFQLFAFMFLVAMVIHTLTAMQDKWYGWVTAIVIVAIISVFTPIAPLRAALVWFFNLIIFNNHAWLQIISCLLLGTLVYMANRPILARKTI